jgi:hypothetical protein
VGLHKSLGAIDASWDDAGRGILLEAFGVKHAALSAVEAQDGLVECHTRKSLVYNAARNAGGGSLASHCTKEALEIAAALRGPNGTDNVQGDKKTQDWTCDHGIPHHVRALPRKRSFNLSHAASRS